MIIITALFLLITPTLADSNGMDMSMDVPMGLAVGHMIPYVHFTPGDTLWFAGWVPSTADAMVGACIGIFLLAILERWLATCLQLAEHHWAARSIAISSLSSSSSPEKSKRCRLPPFVPEFDITRGILFSMHRFLEILLMLAVMTFQVSFLFSILIGSGLGETLFGRYRHIKSTVTSSTGTMA